MAGWLVLTYDNDGYEMFETIGNSRLEIAKAGYPEQREVGTGLVSVEWFDEEPKPKGKTLAEATAEAEEKAQAQAEKDAAKAEKEAEKAAAK